MLSLVLGASTHSFELMLASFILGLALGGLSIAPGSPDRDPPGSSAVIQVAMGQLARAIASRFKRRPSTRWRGPPAVTRTDRASSFSSCPPRHRAAVMLPTTFCAGMTRPSSPTAAAPPSAKSLGAVYASNTVGGVAVSGRCAPAAREPRPRRHAHRRRRHRRAPGRGALPLHRRFVQAPMVYAVASVAALASNTTNEADGINTANAGVGNARRW